MKRAAAYLIAGVAFAIVFARVPAAASAAPRTWTDSSGQHKIEADFVECVDGRVKLKRADGGVLTIALDKLSEADQAVVKRLQSGQTEPEAKPEGGPGGTSSVGKQATVEFQSGSKLEGEVVARDDTSITVRVKMGDRQYTRKCPLDRVRAITVDGRREVLAGGEGEKPGETPAEPKPSESGKRTPAQVKALIAQVGRAPPEWWDSVALEYPKTLDLSFPERPQGPWNAQRNVGQYIWDVINPNPAKWREGVRFLHHLLGLHEKDPQTQNRVMRALGRMYHSLLQDYARAAFWWEKAGVDRSDGPEGVDLADCYWQLGCKPMALDLLGKLPTYFSSIKLLADMGETRRALQIAESAARSEYADTAYLYAGDACRLDGQYAKALDYYQKVLQVPPRPKNQGGERIERNQERARANIEGIKIFDSLDLGKVPDGKYRGSSPGYAGQVSVEVEVRAGRIESVKVVDHKEKQFYAAIDETPVKIIAKQGLKGVDTTSGATITSEAIVNATAKALSQAAK